MKSRTSLLREFEQIVSLPEGEIISRLPRDSLPIGYFCPYVPEELLHAAGALPFRLMGNTVRLTHGQTHLPPNCCHLVKASLESLLRGELNFLKGVVFSHTCDAMQGLSDIWAFQRCLPLHFDFMMPTNLATDRARPYLKAEIERLKAFLEEEIREIPADRLRASIHLFNEIREKIRTLYRLRRKSPHSLSGTALAQLIRAGYVMDRRLYLERLTDLLREYPEEEEPGVEALPLYLTGNMVHHPAHFTIIEEAGASIVYDHLCGGGRFLRLMTREDLEPVDALTERYLSSFLCPTKHSGAEAHREVLLHEVEETGAKGVVFLFYKYCESHYFDYPDLKNALEARGIPTILLEVDDPATSHGQMKTRIQAFVEMLSQL